MNKNKFDKEKVKAICKKSLDVFCYIVTALAFTLGIAMGVNSCSGSNEPKRIDPQQESTNLRKAVVPTAEDVYVYECKYPVTSSVNFDYLRSYYDVPSTTSPYQRGDVTYRYFFYGYWVSDSGEFVEVNSLRFTWVDMQINETGQFEYCLDVVWVLSDVGWYGAVRKEDSNAVNNVYSFAKARLVLNDEEITDTAFLSIYQLSPSIPFTFNASFNYNAPFNLPYNAVYGSSLSWSGGGDNMKHMDYDTGWFWSNGRLFNQLQWWAIKGDGVAVVIDSQITTLPAGDNWVYTFMYYTNTLSGESVLVNSRDSIPYNSGNSRYYANSSTWQVPAYRNITLLNSPDNSTIDLLGSFNNNNAYDTGLSVGGDMGDVFTLVGSAFAGLLPILTLQILPSVTIGTLLFVPLVAILVFAIIRIIKK